MEKKQPTAYQTKLFDDEKLDKAAKELWNFGEFLKQLHGEITTDFPTVQELTDFVDKKGFYFPIPTASVYQRSKDYYNEKIGSITKLLVSSGLGESTIEAIKQDYFFALTGYYDFRATPSQMVEAWEHLQPYFPYIFQIDRYGFYYILMMSYYCYSMVYLEFCRDYLNGDEQTQIKYLEKIAKYTMQESRGVVWFLRKGVATPFDFIQKGLDFAAMITAKNGFSSNTVDYVYYFLLAKYAYRASFEELQEIRSPQITDHPNNGKDEFFVFALCEAENIQKTLNEKAEQYAATADSNKTEEEQEAAKTEAAKPIKLPYNFNRVNQKAIQLGFDWADERTYLPLTQYIMDVWPNTENGIKYTGVTVTEYIIKQAVGGIALLASFDKNIKQQRPQNGIFTFRTTLSEFAELCTGYADANAREKQQLIAALKIIDNTYFLIDKPRKKTTAKGKTITPTKTFVKLASLRQYDTAGGIVLDITADVLDNKNRLLPISYDVYKQMRKDAKSLPKRNFMEIILGMDNREEQAFIDDCFGYATAIEEAQKKVDKAQDKVDKARNEAAKSEALGELMRAQQKLREEQENNRKHRGDAKKKLREWIKDYIEKGYIKVDYDKFLNKPDYTTISGFDLPVKNKAGKFVYFWYRGGKKKKKLPVEDAEIVDETKSLPPSKQG